MQTENVLYRKVGSRYYPVQGTFMPTDGLWLVSSNGSSKTIIKHVDKEFIESIQGVIKNYALQNLFAEDLSRFFDKFLQDEVMGSYREENGHVTYSLGTRYNAGQKLIEFLSMSDDDRKAYLKENCKFVIQRTTREEMEKARVLLKKRLQEIEDGLEAMSEDNVVSYSVDL